jgi:hypothetical protein
LEAKMGNDLVSSASLDDTIRLATALAKSGFYKDIRDAAQGVVKLQIAKELGLGMRGISEVHIVEGKPTLSYQVILSKVRMFTGPHGTDRYSFKYTRRDDECVEIDWLINGEVVGTSKCDTEDAKRMGLDGRGTWKKYPRQMRTARAATEGVNAFMPEVMGGSIYTPEEMGFDSGSSFDGGAAVEAGEVSVLPSSQVASSDAPSPAPLTLKSVDEKADDMVTEAIVLLDAAEETLEGEVIDYTDTWIEMCKKFFTDNVEHKAEYAELLQNAGYLPPDKLTAKAVYATLAETLGPRCGELDLLMKELSA